MSLQLRDDDAELLDVVARHDRRRPAPARLPHRGNSNARRFGSWDAALRAACLEERLARPEPRPTGGVARREAQAEAQRERVLATLRYGVALHGSLPTAMQFFRWRLVDAPATPTQATVYRLFPGGWNAVLEAFGEPDPRVMSPAPR